MRRKRDCGLFLTEDAKTQLSKLLEGREEAACLIRLEYASPELAEKGGLICAIQICQRSYCRNKSVIICRSPLVYFEYFCGLPEGSLLFLDYSYAGNEFVLDTDRKQGSPDESMMNEFAEQYRRGNIKR